MHLLHWEPCFVLSGESPNSSASLHFKAQLECPVCHSELEVEPSGHTMHERDAVDHDFSLIMRIGWEIDSIAEQRACLICGVVSTLPAGHLEDFTGEAHATLTAEFIKAELTKLRTEADAHWQEKYGVSALRPKVVAST